MLQRETVFLKEYRMIRFKSIIILALFLINASRGEGFLAQVSPPWGYVFYGWDGPPVDVIVYIPKETKPSDPVLVVVPGASRDTQRFHGSWLSLAKENNFVVVTIGAPKNYFPDEWSYNAGGIMNGNGEVSDEKTWLFSAIEPIFNDVKKKYKIETKKFHLFGHSAGGGFVHRFMLFKPDAPVARAVAANPAFVTLPNYNSFYPFGLGGLSVDDRSLGRWFDSEMAIVLGEKDLGPRTQPLSNGKEAKEQGPHCFARGTLLYKVSKQQAKSKKTNFKWRLITAPGVGHDNLGVAPYACKYLFGE